MGNFFVVVFYCLVFKAHTWLQMQVSEQPAKIRPSLKEPPGVSVVDHGRLFEGNRHTVLRSRLFYYSATWINR
jgi:hypothetical protein